MIRASDKTPCPQNRRLSEAECERLVAQHAPLVAAIARSMARRLPANIDADDLIQDGMVGLLVAIIQSNTLQAGQSYNAYLSHRIAINKLSHELGRMPREGEVAKALGMSLDAYQTLLQQADGYTLFSLDDFDEVQLERSFISWCVSTDANPLAALERKSVQCTLLQALSELTEREEDVMRAYYSDQRTMREISALLGITVGRVSQLHAQAIARLRAVVLGEGAQSSLLRPRWRSA